MIYTPVLITTLCRYEHLARLLESLKANSWAKYTDVYLGLDYPPSEKYRNGWNNIISYLDNGDFSTFKSFNVVKRDKNYGFENNADDLLNQLQSKYDRFIVLEDDLELSPNYLEYMNKCLDAFENDPSVVAVTGYSYPVKWDVSEGATCMKQNYNAAAWGRGFWKSKRTVYLQYISSGQMLRDVGKVIANKSYKKMIDASLREYIPATMSPSKRLHKFMYFPCDISLRAYLAVDDKYIISPVVSKVRNYGFDGSGIYCQNIDIIDGQTAGSYNYGLQPIDSNNSFELIVDSFNNIEINHEKLNTFDKRTPKQMALTKTYMWIINYWGVNVARIIAIIYFPFEVIERLSNKIISKLK